jgi:hypothetical protein
VVAQPPSFYADPSSPPSSPSPKIQVLDNLMDGLPDPSRMSLEVAPSTRHPTNSPPMQNVRARLRSPSPSQVYINLTGLPDSPEVDCSQRSSPSPILPLPKVPLALVDLPRFVQVAKDDDVWFSQTLEEAWPSKQKAKSDTESTEFLIQWGEFLSSSEIGKILLQSFDASNCCLWDDNFFEYLSH